MVLSKVVSERDGHQAHSEVNQELPERLAVPEQAPEALFISCCDSRVIPELITGSKPGELFVTRTVANIVPPYGIGETSVGAVVEYAVRRLRVTQITVCGHTDCGGIWALDEPPDWSREPHIARWIEHARPARTKVEASGLPAKEHHLATVRENVLLQLEHLRSYDPVREAEQAGELTLDGWVYRLETGTIEAHNPEANAFAALQEASESHS